MSLSSIAPNSPTLIEIRVNGMPGAQGSKTATRWGGMKESSPKVAPWRAAVAYSCEQQFGGEVITDPVAMEIEFILPRAKHHWSKAKGKEDQLVPSAPLHCTSSSLGDIDKLARSTLDGCALRSGGCLIADDSQVVQLSLFKRYAEAGEPSGALVRVRNAP